MLQLQRASAGSGKTEQLARQYLQIFFRSPATRVDPATILAATFTREAAGEMLARIFRIVARACKEEEVRRGLVAGTSFPIPRQEECYALLRQLVNQITQLEVGTIDALFARQARALALDLGLASPWKVADALTCEALARETTVRLLEKYPEVRATWRLLHRSTRQLFFVDKAASLLEKNRHLALVERWDARSLEDFPPQRIAEAQAAEILLFLEAFEIPSNAKGKPDGRWEKALQKVHHAFSHQILLKDLLEVGALMANCLHQEPAFFSKALPSDFLERFVPLVNACVEERKRLECVREKALQQIIRHYDELRQVVSFCKGSYTFSEIETAVQSENHTFSAEEIEFRMEARTEHLLLDEYQDTSQRQHDFLSPLVGNVLAKGGMVFVVGDVKQGIYGWRGGKRHLLGLLAEEHEGHVEEMPLLNRSYRSSHAILEAVNEVFGALKNPEAREKMKADDSFHHAAKRWACDFQPHEAAARVAALRGRVTLHTVASSPEAESNDDDPMRAVVAKVVRLVEEHYQEDPLREIAILVRRTKFIPQLLQGLRLRGIVASGEGGNPLTDTLAIEAILSLLSWIDHPGHTAAYEHVQHSPLKFLLASEQEGTHEAILMTFRKMLLESGYAATLRSWIFMPAFQEACSDYEQSRLEQLLAMADRFDAVGGGLPSAFVKQVRQERVESPLSMGVRVLSIHAAKGLEFESVILMDLDTDITAGSNRGLRVQLTEEGSFFIQSNQEMMKLQGREHLLAGIHEEQWAEALSLLYVGMTRAGSYLDLVVFEEEKRKKSMAQWLRASGLTFHEKEGISWRSLHVKPPSPSLPLPSWSVPQQGRIKLFQRSPSQERENGKVFILEQLQGRAARQHGILIHAILAELLWDHCFPKAEEIAGRLRQQQTLERSIQLLLWIATAGGTLFKEDSYLEQWKYEKVVRIEVWRERRFAVARKGLEELLLGVFDRVVLGYNNEGVVVRAEIIDFKTDAVSENEKENRASLYQSQLNTYREALLEMIPTLEYVKTRLVWVHLNDGRRTV